MESPREKLQSGDKELQQFLLVNSYLCTVRPVYLLLRFRTIFR